MRRASLVLLIGTCAALGACQTRPPLPASSTPSDLKTAWLGGIWVFSQPACDGTDYFMRFGADGSYYGAPEGPEGRWFLDGSELTIRAEGEIARFKVLRVGANHIQLTDAGGDFALYRCPEDG